MDWQDEINMHSTEMQMHLKDIGNEDSNHKDCTAIFSHHVNCHGYKVNYVISLGGLC
jgi:hypothetical protein